MLQILFHLTEVLLQVVLKYNLHGSVTIDLSFSQYTLFYSKKKRILFCVSQNPVTIHKLLNTLIYNCLLLMSRKFAIVCSHSAETQVFNILVKCKIDILSY